MIIAAVSDVHSPRNYVDFVKAIETLKARPDLFLMAGDMVDRGNVEEYDKICNVLFGKVTCPIVACFGNNEFEELKAEVKKRHPEIKFLDDDATVVTVGKIMIGIVGTTGSLDTPTPWQKQNIPNIERLYQERVSLVDRLLVRMKTDMRIVLMHYAPTYKSLEGDNPRFFSTMGTRMYEPVFENRKPNLVVHGHSIRGTKKVWIDTVPVLNVAFPLNREIVLIDTEKDLKPGIAKFV